MGGRVSGESPWRRYPRVVPVASPAAGTDWSVSVPGGFVWDLVSVIATLVTSATVINRGPVLRVSDGNRVFVSVPPHQVQAASLTWRYSWFEHAEGIQQSGYASAPLPRLRLDAGSVIDVTTVNLDAGDQWSGVVLAVWETAIRSGEVDIGSVPEMMVEVAPSSVS